MDLTEALHKIQQLEQEISSLRRELQLAKLQAPDEGYRERFIVNTFKGEKVVDVSEVRYIVSENKSTYIVLHDGSSFNIDMPLSIIAGQLCPRTFMKVNRKYIIPLSMVERFEQDINGKIWSMQYIQPDGTKRLASGSRKVLGTHDNKHDTEQD